MIRVGQGFSGGGSAPLQGQIGLASGRASPSRCTSKYYGLLQGVGCPRSRPSAVPGHQPAPVRRRRGSPTLHMMMMVSQFRNLGSNAIIALCCMAATFDHCKLDQRQHQMIASDMSMATVYLVICWVPAGTDVAKLPLLAVPFHLSL